MRKVILFLLILMVASGCSFFKKQETVIKMGDIEISKEEFEEAFLTSSYVYGGGDLKNEFLEKYISRKLILQEAVRLELDRDPQFLSDVQLFWEQSLLKLALSKKIKELSIDTQVSDQEIRSYYKKNKDPEFIERELSEVYDQVKWIVFNEKQRQAVSEWSESLRKNVDIYIDYEALEIEKK